MNHLRSLHWVKRIDDALIRVQMNTSFPALCRRTQCLYAFPFPPSAPQRPQNPSKPLKEMENMKNFYDLNVLSGWKLLISQSGSSRAAACLQQKGLQFFASTKWRKVMFRTAVEHARKHPGLIPQFFFICLGMGGATLYLIRLARGPHVTWNKTQNPEPWNKLDPTFQYKFVAIETDYKNLKKEGPDF